MAAAFFFFWALRRKSQKPRPIKARPATGPTTAPAIHALLELSGDGEGEAAGDVVPAPAPEDTGELVVELRDVVMLAELLVGEEPADGALVDLLACVEEEVLTGTVSR